MQMMTEILYNVKACDGEPHTIHKHIYTCVFVWQIRPRVLSRGDTIVQVYSKIPSWAPR